MKWIFDNFTKLLALLSFDLIATATLHDWGYFYIVGPQFRSIQTTYDYITHAIEWLPGILFLFIIAAGVVLIAAFITRSRVVVGFEGQHSLTFRRRGRIAAAIMACVAMLWLIISLYQSYPYNLYLLGASITVFSLIVFAMFFDSVRKSRSPFVVLLFGISSFILLSGVQEGIADIQRISNVYRLQLKGTSATQVMLLRAFEKGILAKNPADNQVEFVRWDQIDKLGRRVSFAIEPSGCRLFGFFCRQIIVP